MLEDPYKKWVIENLEKPGMSQTGLAKVLGVHPSAVNKIVSGKRGLKSHEVALAATYFGEAAPSSELTPYNGALSVIPIIGTVEAGAFREVDDFDQSEPRTLTLPRDDRFPNARQIGFDVSGDSMNDLKPRPILAGDCAVCVAYEDVAGQVVLRDGMVVVVERTRDSGHFREWSVKQIEIYADRTEFHPRSTNPKHKPIVVHRNFEADDGVKVEVIALVRRIVNEMPGF
ncbi:transcriptional regulator with XRE-family HTH domain [Ensifer sp. KUDG1]|uniref:LexA family protein n=1 Tax=Ensifer sp. KUDG1 TaxID=3373919 RepID=UPI003D2353EA